MNGPGAGQGRADVKYKPTMSTTDVLPADTITVGGGRHLLILDLIDAIESAEEEDLFRLLLHGWTQEQVADELGINQSTVSRRLKKLVFRAAGHDGPCDERCIEGSRK